MGSAYPYAVARVWLGGGAKVAVGCITCPVLPESRLLQGSQAVRGDDGGKRTAGGDHRGKTFFVVGRARSDMVTGVAKPTERRPGIWHSKHVTTCVSRMYSNL